jgi:hypothetical protein
MMAWITIIALWALVGACIVWLSVESAEDVRTRRAEGDAERKNEPCPYPAGHHPTATHCLYCGKEL